jgi:hypothetical protein
MKTKNYVAPLAALVCLLWAYQPVNGQGTNKALYDSPMEEFTAKLDSYHILQKVKEKTGASSEQFNLFCRFYEDTIQGRDKQIYGYAILHKQIQTDEDVKLYAEKRIEHYIALYHKFAEFAKEYPETVHEYLAPRRPSPPSLVCNPACDNMDFEQGTLTAWTACYAANNSTSSSFSSTTPTCFGPLGAVTTAAYDSSTGTNQVSITSGNGLDPVAGAFIPVVCPTGGKYSVMVGDGTVPNYGVGILEQTFMVTAANVNLTYMYAVVLENPNHVYYDQTYFKIEVLDQNGNPVTSGGQYFVVCEYGLPGYTGIYYPREADTIYCKPWTTQHVSLINYIGTCVTIRVTSSDCGLGGHFGYAYFDAKCDSTGLFLNLISTTNVLCNGNNGSAAVIAMGGTAPYTYSWSPGGQTTDSISGLSAGTYMVTVSDSTGNRDSLAVSITSLPVAATVTGITNNFCNGTSTGSATATFNGGIPPYIYLWNPGGQTTDTAKGLSTGAYTVTITDSNGCTATGSVTISSLLSPISVHVTSTEYYCPLNPGSAIAYPSGGAQPYTYLWNPGGQRTNPATGLSAGVYSVIVTDSNGCSKASSVSVSSASVSFIVYGSPTTIVAGDSATLYAQSSLPATYVWSIGATTSSITVTPAVTTTYTVIATTACGNDTGTVTITVSACGLNVYTNSLPAYTCPPSLGSASVRVYPGTPPYTYLWSPGGQTTDTITGLPAGTYSVTVKDSNGCTATNTVMVYSTSSSITSYIISTPYYCAAFEGAAIVYPSGGNPPYIYRWSPGGKTTDSITGLSAGTYSVAIIDSNGCKGSAAVSVFSASVSFTVYGYPTTINAGDSAYLFAFSNIPFPAVYIWSTGATTALIFVTPTVTTTYTVTAYTPCGPYTDTITVYVNGANGIPVLNNSSTNLNIYPNPSTGMVNIQSSVVSSQWSVEVYDVLGQVVYQKTEQINGGKINEQVNLTDLSDGIYTLRLITDNGSAVRKVVIMR